MRLTLVRHGETQWNRDRRFQGQCDVPLTEHGLTQARAIARALQSQTFDYAVSSDLRRSLETARVVVRRIAIVGDERWREFDFGAWEGLTWEEIVARWPEAAKNAVTDARQYAPVGGETFAQLERRVGHALDGLRSASAREILVVTHAGPLHAALYHLFGEAAHIAKGVRFFPASITRIRFDREVPVLELLNDTSHLSF